MAVDVQVPELGESVTSGVISRWHKQSGDHVQRDDPLFDLETDKAAMEIAAEAAGRLEVVVPEGSTVQVGTVVARITDDVPAESTPEPGPAVRKLVAEQGLDPARITGTGKDGRLTKADVLQAQGRATATSAVSTAVDRTSTAAREGHDASRRAPADVEPKPSRSREPAPPSPDETPRSVDEAPRTPDDGARSAGDGTRRVPMSQLRRVIAERLVEAQRTAAILTTFNEIDMTAVQALRRRHRERFRAAHGVDLGLISLFARAIVLALRAVPVVNARIDGADIVYHDAVHLGIAVSTSRGLVVPVVRQAETMSVAKLERAITDLAERARATRLSPDDLMGGTFTITNGGVFGSLLSTPVLNPPQAGILGMHKIEDRPVALEGQVVIRPMMYVALSYDHRLIDGAEAVTFLVRVKEQLEDPARMLLDV